MPNHITNIIKISGNNSKELMEKYFIRGKEDEDGEGMPLFDFNKVVPMPQQLQDTVISSSTPEEVYENNRKEYGYPDWYSWAIANWGTKWNAYWQTFNDYNDFVITTAWSSPFELMLALSKQVPTLTIEVTYADEDIGYNVGIYVLKDGDVIQTFEPEGGSKEAYELAFQVHPDDEDWYVWDDNEGCYVDRED